MKKRLATAAGLIALVLELAACGPGSPVGQASPSVTSNGPSPPPVASPTPQVTVSPSSLPSTPGSPSPSIPPRPTIHVTFTLTIYGVVPAYNDFWLYFNSGGQTEQYFCTYAFDNPCVGGGKQYTMRMYTQGGYGIQDYRFERVQNANTATPTVTVFRQGLIDGNHNGAWASAVYTFR